MANKYYRGFEKLFKFGKSRGEDTGKSINTIVGVAPSKNIKKFQEQKEKIIKMTDSYKKKVNDPEVKKSMNEGTSKTLSNISKIYKGEPITKKVKKVEKKAMGGRIGRRLGGGTDMAKKKTNVQKIKETFAPKNKNLKPVDKKKQKGLAKLPIEVRNKMGYAKKGGRA